MNTITHWDPIRTLTSLQDEVNRLFENGVNRGNRSASNLTAWAPLVDIFETAQELVLKADLPDLDEREIDVRVENNMLTISGERKFEQSERQDNYLRVERAYGTFSRSFALPNTVNPERIDAEYRNGVLTVKMAKREESRPKQIKVAVSSNGK
ncbi:MAG: Hsp20/alpha crystallin family protein [Acidipila sp.]|nr:Hsp20/alpha crystallin family protein [Acidipila sp.]